MKEKKQLAGYRPYNNAPAQQVLNAGYEKMAAKIVQKLIADDHVYKGDAQSGANRPRNMWSAASVERALLANRGEAVLALLPFLNPNYYNF